MRTRCARRHCRPRAVPFPTPRGGDLGQQRLGNLANEPHRARIVPQGRDKGGAAAGHERGDEHAALERSHDAAPVAEQLPHPLDPRRGRRHVDARADMRVGQGAAAQVALGERGHQQRGAAVLARRSCKQRYLGARERRCGLRRVNLQPHVPILDRSLVIPSYTPARTRSCGAGKPHAIDAAVGPRPPRKRNRPPQSRDCEGRALAVVGTR